MSPAYLSEACVAQATQNYTILLSAAELTKTCTIIPPHLSRSKVALIALAAIFTILLLLHIATTRSRNSTIRHLRNIPSHQLHDEIELLYAQSWGTGLSKAAMETDIDARKGRIKNVSYETDTVTRERTIMVVENIDYLPQPRRIYEGAAARRQRIRREMLDEAARRALVNVNNATAQLRVVRPWNAGADASNPATWPTNTTRQTSTMNAGTGTADQPRGQHWDGASESSIWPTTNTEVPAPVYSPQVAPPAYTKHFSNHHA